MPNACSPVEFYTHFISQGKPTTKLISDKGNGTTIIRLVQSGSIIFKIWLSQYGKRGLGIGLEETTTLTPPPENILGVSITKS